MYPIVEYATVAWSPHAKGLPVSNPFNAAQHVLLTAITAAIVVFHLCLLIWTGLYCSQGSGYAISACFIRFIEVKSTSPFPMTLPPCLRMAVQGWVKTLRSGYHPLQATLTNTLSMWDRIPAWNALSADVVSSASYPEFIRRDRLFSYYVIQYHVNSSLHSWRYCVLGEGDLAAEPLYQSSPTPLFLDRSSAAKTLITQYRQLRRLCKFIPCIRVTAGRSMAGLA